MSRRQHLQVVWAAAGSSIVIIQILGWVIVPGPGEEALLREAPPTSLVALLGAAAAVGVVAPALVARRPLPPRDAPALVSRFTTGIIAGLTVAEAPAVLGFVLAVVRAERWPLLVGLASLAGAFATRPSSSLIHTHDQQLLHAGSPVTLSEALDAPP